MGAGGTAVIDTDSEMMSYRGLINRMIEAVPVGDPRADREYHLDEPWMFTDAFNFFCGEFWNLAWDNKGSPEPRLWVEPVFYLPIVYGSRDRRSEIGVMNALYPVGTIEDTVFEIPTIK